MNLLQSVAAALFLLAVFCVGAWLAHEHGKRSASLALDVEAAMAEQRADHAEASALLALAVADSARAEAGRHALEADSLEGVTVAQAGRIERLTAALDRADSVADTFAEAYAETGDVADCDVALTACQDARAASQRVIDGLSDQLDTRADLVAVQARQVEALETSADSLASAARSYTLALSEQRQATERYQRLAASERAQKKAWRLLAPVGTAIGFALGVLAAK